LYSHPVFQVNNLRSSLSDEVIERYRQAVDLVNPGCPATEQACKCTLILRHQVLLGQSEDMDDIIEALWKVMKNIDELS
jgi:hypothetical protein